MNHGNKPPSFLLVSNVSIEQLKNEINIVQTLAYDTHTCTYLLYLDYLLMCYCLTVNAHEIAPLCCKVETNKTSPSKDDGKYLTSHTFVSSNPTFS